MASQFAVNLGGTGMVGANMAQLRDQVGGWDVTIVSCRAPEFQTRTRHVACDMIGVWLYVRGSEVRVAAGRWGRLGLVLFLFVVYAGNVLGSPPSSVEILEWIGQLQWLLVL